MGNSKSMKISLSNQMIIASVAGIAAGLIFGETMGNIKFLGDIFLRLMQMSVVFLVMGAIIEAVGGLDPKDLGKLGGKTLSLFVIFTLFASFVGLILAVIIQPGVGVVGVSAAEFTGKLPEGKPLDLIVNFFTKNVFDSMARGDMLQVIIFSGFFGLSLSLLKKNESGLAIFNLVKNLNVVIMQIISTVMKVAPIGIFALIASITGTAGVSVIVALGKFLITLTLGCLALFALLIAIVSTYGKINPLRLIKKLKRTIIVSITTTSSAVSLPVQMEDSEERIGISKRVSRLVNPLGMNLNSHGLAITVAIASVTVAQFFGTELSMGQLIMIAIYATLATFANLAVPGGALVTMAIAFSMAGLPLEGIAILAGVDWFAGIVRTFLNVVDDVLVALIVAISEKEFDRKIFDADETTGNMSVSESM
ncbi:dicarboxylate/amino acid:cation symporter [Brevibacillus sp. SYSU BS000544]|uniref:dicarboxylate/amino acid:cation symporter n=1 Tax=Brevibacillus sp. SYSU BS000544 TaxID=3416443 RepID=UPI003CE4E085